MRALANGEEETMRGDEAANSIFHVAHSEFRITYEHNRRFKFISWNILKIVVVGIHSKAQQALAPLHTLDDKTDEISRI